MAIWSAGNRHRSICPTDQPLLSSLRISGWTTTFNPARTPRRSPWPTPRCRTIPEDDASGYQTPYEAEQERLDRIYRGYGGDRFDPPDLAGDPQADALSGSGQQPPLLKDRLRHGADAAQAADAVGAGAAGLAAVQAFRSQLPQEAADYFRQNVMPRPGPQPQPPPQIIGRPSDVERLLGEAGQRAQEVERGAAQAIEETAAVAAKEGEAAAAAEGVGGAFGYLGSLAEGAAALAPRRAVGATLAGAAGVGAAGAAGLAVGLAGGAAYGLVKGTEWVLDNTIFRPQQGGGDEAVQDVRSANGMNDITQAQHFSLRSGSTPSHSRTSSVVSNSDPGCQSSSSQPSSRASSASSFRVQAQSNHTPRPFAWNINPVMPQRKSPASSRASSSSRGSGLPPPSFEQLARDIEAA